MWNLRAIYIGTLSSLLVLGKCLSLHLLFLACQIISLHVLLYIVLMIPSFFHIQAYHIYPYFFLSPLYLSYLSHSFIFPLSFPIPLWLLPLSLFLSLPLSKAQGAGGAGGPWLEATPPLEPQINWNLIQDIQRCSILRAFKASLYRGHSMAVASLTVPGGQEFHFPHFFPEISINFSDFSSNFTYFLPHFGPPHGRVTHPGRPWLHHWRASLTKIIWFLSNFLRFKPIWLIFGKIVKNLPIHVFIRMLNFIRGHSCTSRLILLFATHVCSTFLERLVVLSLPPPPPRSTLFTLTACKSLVMLSLLPSLYLSLSLSPFFFFFFARFSSLSHKT